MQKKLVTLLVVGVALFLVGCAPPGLLPPSPSPIPTLIPATAPSELGEVTPTASYSNLSYPVGVPSAKSGRSLYHRFCADCHGEQGEGLVPEARNFNDVDYMRGEMPVSFYVAVTEGVGDMPGFKIDMTSDERWDVVFYVWQFATHASDLEKGEALYDEYCESCHGPEGTNEDLGAVDFTDLRIVGQIAQRDFYQVITQGKGSMPAWQSRLSQGERWDVIDYLYSFVYDVAIEEKPRESPPPPTATAESVNMGCPGEDRERSNPYPWDDEEIIAMGQAIYDQSCAGCHAEDGTGNVADADDFTAAEVQNRLLAESGYFFCVVAEGEGAMPSWKGSLSEEEIWQVLTYIASFGE